MEWQPIASAPKDGTKILLYWKERYPNGNELEKYEIGHWGEDWDDNDNWIEPRDLEPLAPTHWMWLPDSPLDAEAEVEIQSVVLKPEVRRIYGRIENRWKVCVWYEKDEDPFGFDPGTRVAMKYGEEIRTVRVVSKIDRFSRYGKRTVEYRLEEDEEPRT